MVEHVSLFMDSCFFYLHSIEFYLYYPYLTVTEIIVGDSNYKKSLLNE